jgi:hypothetical protein
MPFRRFLHIVSQISSVMKKSFEVKSKNITLPVVFSSRFTVRQENNVLEKVSQLIPYIRYFSRQLILYTWPTNQLILNTLVDNQLIFSPQWCQLIGRWLANNFQQPMEQTGEGWPRGQVTRQQDWTAVVAAAAPSCFLVFWGKDVLLVAAT